LIYFIYFLSIIFFVLLIGISSPTERDALALRALRAAHRGVQIRLSHELSSGNSSASSNTTSSSVGAPPSSELTVHGAQAHLVDACVADIQRCMKEKKNWKKKREKVQWKRRKRTRRR
jgi:hypothetical protein